MTHANEIPPRVSVGMPVYNGEHYVKAALDAVLAQMLGDFELVTSELTCHSLLAIGGYSV